MDKIEKIRISNLIDAIKNDDLGDALDHLKSVVQFKQEQMRERIINEAFETNKERK